MTDQPEMASAADCSAAIIKKFGGQAPLSRELARLGHTVPQNTIAGWAKTSIPERWRPVLIQIAKAEGIAHRPLDYVAYLIPIAG